jgi:AcrR family transcriptional regulator
MRTQRKQAVTDLKRGLILDAARKIFELEGLDGASLRSIAREAGYTPGAIYFHFPNKEAIYAGLLDQSLDALIAAVDEACAGGTSARLRLLAAAMAFFDFYHQNPRDLDLGFYLFRGGMRPHGLGAEFDRELNMKLQRSLAPIGDAARELGADDKLARRLIAGFFAHAVGLLLLAHTRRIRLFEEDARGLCEAFVQHMLTDLELGSPC